MKKHLITLGLTLGICGLLFGATIYPIEVGIPLVISLAFTAIYITIWILVDSFNKK